MGEPSATLSPGDQWESDRGVCVEIREVSSPIVVLEFVGKALGCIAMRIELFRRVFRHLVRPGWSHV